MANKKFLLNNNKNQKGNVIGDVNLQLKLLYRFRKIFLSKQRLLEVRKEGEITDDIIKSFEQLLTPKGIIEKKRNSYKTEDSSENKVDEASPETSPLSFNDDIREDWFNLTDRESFRAESDHLLRQLPICKAEVLRDKIEEFEKAFSNIGHDGEKYLYYTKHTEGVLNARRIEIDKYASLRRMIKANFPRIGAIDSEKGIEYLKKFIEVTFENKEADYIFKGELWNGKKKNSYDFRNETKFIVDNSDEFKRRILNAYFSEIIGVEPSEEVPFVKRRGGGIDYAAFRILVWLRNTEFNYLDFIHFLNNLNPEELPERMMIDLGLGGIVKTFIKKVRNPEKVDHLIMTHRIVKGLWQNGSKFLNSYTLHNEEHAITLINQSMEIIRRIDYLQLKKLDYYILFLSCYLHDISMVIHPDLQIFCHAEEQNIVKIEPYIREMNDLLRKQSVAVKNRLGLLNFWKESGGLMLKIFNEVYSYFEGNVRDSHAESSAKFILDKRHDLFNYLDETIVSAVARAGRDHSKPEYHIYDLASTAGRDAVSVKYISIILRLADLMDVSNDRVNYHLLHENVQHLSTISKFHWITHLITDEIELIPRYSLETHSNYKDKLLDEDRSIYPPTAYYIKENLRFYMILNVKTLEPIDISEENKLCKGWCRKKYDGSNCPSRYKGYDGITISIQDSNSTEENSDSLCSDKGCPMICHWMVKKHLWVFKELVRLKKYLNSTNHHPFKTDIEVNILFKNEFNIENFLYDEVRRFLKGEHNE